MPFESKKPDFLRPKDEEKNKLKQVNFSLTQEQDFRITKIANVLGKGKSEFLRELVQFALDVYDEKQQENDA